MAVEMARSARPFTYEDLDDMPDDGYRREVIGGTLIVTPPPSGAHQRVTLNLGALLRAGETAETMAMVAPYDWKLVAGDSVQPDVMVIRREDSIRVGHCPAPPFLSWSWRCCRHRTRRRTGCSSGTCTSGSGCRPIGSSTRQAPRC